MKKIVSLIACVTIAASLTACTKKETYVNPTVITRTTYTEICAKKVAPIDAKNTDYSCDIKNNEVTGKFHGDFEGTDTNGNTDVYYQFKSNDNAVWWALTEKEIGFIPDESTEYVLTYDDNGTTSDNKPCDCLPEWECECEVYDDVFLGIKKK